MTAGLRTPLCDLLGCDVPILQAGMGGPARHELAGAVAQAGGVGMLGMVRESPDLIEQEIRALTDRPFGQEDVACWSEVMKPRGLRT